MSPKASTISQVYHDQGNYAQALPLHERAVAIAEKKLGKDHPNTKLYTENLSYAQQQALEAAQQVGIERDQYLYIYPLQP